MAQVYQKCTNTQHLALTLLILQFSTKNIFQAPLNLFWCINLHTFHCGISFDHFQTLNSVPYTRSSSLFNFVQGFENGAMLFLLKLSTTLCELWVGNSHTNWH